MSDAPQQLYPCPVCHRKFIKKSLEVHLRSCDKKGKYSGGHNVGYDNKDFLDKLDKAMEAEEKHSGYKPSQKKEVKALTDQEIFENNLNKAL